MLLEFLSTFHKLFFRLGSNLQTKSDLSLGYKDAQISKIRSTKLDSFSKSELQNEWPDFLKFLHVTTPTDVSKNLNSEFNFSALEIRSLVQVPRYRRVATAFFFFFFLILRFKVQSRLFLQILQENFVKLGSGSKFSKQTQSPGVYRPVASVPTHLWEEF